MCYKVEEKSVKELFSIAGSVVSVEIKKDNGKSKGYGFVGE